jgi:hypothetical protein
VLVGQEKPEQIFVRKKKPAANHPHPRSRSERLGGIPSSCIRNQERRKPAGTPSQPRDTSPSHRAQLHYRALAVVVVLRSSASYEIRELRSNSNLPSNTNRKEESPFVRRVLGSRQRRSITISICLFSFELDSYCL